VDPERVFVSASYGDEVEFHVSAVLDFPDEVAAQLTFSWRQFPSQYVEILGDQGEMRIDPAFNNESQQTSLQLRTQDSSESFEFPPLDPFVLQLEHICDCLDSSHPHRITPDASIGNMKTIDAIYESMKKGQAVPLA
jgi:predicted dehydrogenase